MAEERPTDANTTITIDPITRLEGHGKIDIFLDDRGEVERAYFQVPELRGFEIFCIGRPAEDMPQITSRICGVCPTAHHMAATKALDDLYKVEPPPTGRKIRELVYNTFMLEDHALHVYILGRTGLHRRPGRAQGAAERRRGHPEGRRGRRQEGHRHAAAAARPDHRYFGGKVIHPVLGLPGGVAKGLARTTCRASSNSPRTAWSSPSSPCRCSRTSSSRTTEYVKLITSDTYTHRPTTWGWWTRSNQVNFYDGKIRVVDPSGKEYAKFPAQKYLDYIAEHVEPWSYVKFCYLKPLGWKGFVDGPESGVYAVAPLARLNVADGMATPEAQKAYEEYFATLGGKPVHHTLANHWARVIEMLQAAERMRELRQRSRDHGQGHPDHPDGHAHGGHRRGRSPARHADPPLRDRRATDSSGRPT